MNLRLIKEFRAVWLPWAAGLVACLVMLDHRAQQFAAVAGVACAALLAAMSMGNEFHQGTFALLLSQPCPRRDLWREKLLVLAALAGTLGLLMFWVIAGSEVSGVPYVVLRFFFVAVVCSVPLWTLVARSIIGGLLFTLGGTLLLLLLMCLASAGYGGPGAPDAVMPGVFFVAVVCTAPLWTLVARSIIGGMVFSLAGALVLLLLTTYLGVEKLFGPRFPNGIPDNVYACAWSIVGLSYSGVCLLAGWRKFARLELKDAILGESAILSTAAVREGRWWNWLRMRPTGSLLNLVRKELRLQKPVFVVAAVFSVCWLAVTGLHQWGPEHGYEGLYEELRILLPVVYIPLVLAVAAAISLGEERTLGLAAWHLTLPVSARRQWLLKLAVGAAVAIGLGLVLPGLVGWATLPEFRAGLHQAAQEPFMSHGNVTGLLAEVSSIGTALWLFFVLSFWAATLLGNTVRAVSTALLGVGALWLCLVLSAWLANRMGGLQTDLLRNIIWWLQLEPGVYRGEAIREAMIWGPVVAGLVLSLVALAQSLVLFRRAQVQRGAVVRSAGLLLAIAFLAAFWWVDFQESVSHGL